VPMANRDPASRSGSEPAGTVTIVGALRWPEAAGWFTPAADPAANLWFVRDPSAIAVARGLGAVAPFYIEQEAPVPSGGLPRPGRLVPNLPNNHLGYMLTWYGLAVALAVVFLAWVLSRRRRAPADPRA
jgi:surfeit locus 1 family protein